MTLASDPSKNLQDSARLSTPGPNATKQTLMMIKGEKLHELLRDFDDHLDDSYVSHPFENDDGEVVVLIL